MDLRLEHAHYVLAMTPGERLPNIALAMLESGLDSPALRELAGLDRPTLRDAAHLFERALAETGQPPLSVAEARDVALIGLLEDIVALRIDPGAGALELWARADDFGKADEWVHFIALHSAYEDHPPHRPKLGAEIVAAAKELLRQRRHASA
jgi:hypothetical protein